MDIGSVLKALLVAGAVAIGLGSTWLLKEKPDNMIEQLSEEVIKEETGVDIDLSPSLK